MKAIKVFAPASIANLAVGFDILGMAFEAIGDTITLAPRKDEALNISVEGARDIPLEWKKNTAGVALKALMIEGKIPHGFDVSIKKGIPLSSGLGGSAASAVAAVLAGNQFLKKKLKLENLIPFALEGEFVASGARHADNVAPSLLGGITAIVSENPLRAERLAAPKGVFVCAIHPELEVQTKKARAVLGVKIGLREHITQSAHLLGFVSACRRSDLEQIRLCMLDLIVEPQREHFIPGFGEAKNNAMSAGALGFSISGAGPTVFAWAASKSVTSAICEGTSKIFAKHDLRSRSWIRTAVSRGARVL